MGSEGRRVAPTNLSDVSSAVNGADAVVEECGDVLEVLTVGLWASGSWREPSWQIGGRWEMGKTCFFVLVQ